MSKYNPTGAEPVPDSLLIYAAKGDTYLPSNENVKFNDDLSIPFEAGKTYRLRIINMGIFSMNYFWIDGHEMRVIEADGVRLVPFHRFHPILTDRSSSFDLTDRHRGIPCRSPHAFRRSTILGSRHCSKRYLFKLPHSFYV